MMMASAPETRKASDTRETESRIHKIGDAANNATDEASNIGKRGTEVAEEATKTATDVAQHVADKGRETISAGMRTMADASASLVDIGYGRGRRFVEASARVTDFYREAGEETAADVQALTTTYSQLGQGLMRMQHAYFNAMQQSLARAKRRPQDLLRCKSVTEFAEVQRDLYTDNVAFMLQSSTTLMRLAGEIVQNVAGPLEARRATAGTSDAKTIAKCGSQRGHENLVRGMRLRPKRTRSPHAVYSPGDHVRFHCAPTAAPMEARIGSEV
jgi:Phasin protein